MAGRRREGMLALASLAVLAPLALALAISFAVTPEQIERGDVHVAPACTIRRILGHPCPTCGLTRAFAALSHGRLEDAAGYNRAGLVVYVVWWLGAAAALGAALRAGVRYATLRTGRDSSSPWPQTQLALGERSASGARAPEGPT